MKTCFKKNDDKSTQSKVKFMKWSTVMDLIAIALKNGDVSIHRLVNWQKVWMVPCPGRQTAIDKPKCEIISMEWRPDGKILAVCYNMNIKDLESGQDSSVALIDLENGQVIDVIVLNQSYVVNLCWQNKVDFVFDNEYQTETFADCLPKIPILSKTNSSGYARKYTEEGIENLMRVESQSSLNVLAIATNDAKVYFYCFGVYLAGVLQLPSKKRTDHIALSSDLGQLTIIQSESDNSIENQPKTDYTIQTYGLAVFKDSSNHFFMLSRLYAKVQSLLSYLDEVMGCLQENMEEMLLELDSKLSNLQSITSSHAILLADELLELLVVGTLSESLEKFLNQLTDKGLKKLGHSIESLYSNIQKLVVCNIQRVCERIFSYLHVLKAMALWQSEFAVVGLRIEGINRAIHAVASFYFKSLELQQVIDSSSQNVKCFFRWLYMVSCRLNNESPPSNESSKLSQQDLHYVADFIEENFDHQKSRSEADLKDVSQSSRPTATNFTLERVAQYLRSEALAYPTFSSSEVGLNPWFKYLKERTMLLLNDDDSNLILYRFNPEASLVGEFKHVVQSIDEAFKGASFKFSENNGTFGKSNIATRLRFYGPDFLRVTHLSGTSDNKLFSLGFCFSTDVYNEITLIKYPMSQDGHLSSEIVTFEVEIKDNNETYEMRPLDLHFYNEDILSLIVQAKDKNLFYLVQFPITLARNQFTPIGLNTKLSKTVPTNKVVLTISRETKEASFRQLEDFKPHKLAVSGSRRVSCILSKGQKRLRIFEMDGYESDDCEDDEK